MDPIGYLGILVALAGLAGAAWSGLGRARTGARPAGGSRIGGVAVFALVFAIGLAIVLLAVRGSAGADTDGRWHVRFEIDGAAYEGELVLHANAGPLTVTYSAEEGPRRAREQCRLRRDGPRVEIRCSDARMIDGAGSYSPDDFDLTFVNPTTLQGSVSSRAGAAAGSALFARR
jgi:hypothetical protein